MRTRRERRAKPDPDPEPASPEEEADIEARYRLLYRRIKRYAARMEALYPGYLERVRRDQERERERERTELGTHTHFAPDSPPAPAK